MRDLLDIIKVECCSLLNDYMDELSLPHPERQHTVADLQQNHQQIHIYSGIISAILLTTSLGELRDYIMEMQTVNESLYDALNGIYKEEFTDYARIPAYMEQVRQLNIQRRGRAADTTGGSLDDSDSASSLDEIPCAAPSRCTLF